MILMARSDKKSSPNTADRSLETGAWTGRHCIASLPSAASWVREDLLSVLRHLQWPARDLFAVSLAVEEALTNAIKHGSHGRSDCQIYVSYEASRENLRVKITDSGGGFDPRAVLDRRRDQPFNIPAGRGLLLMLRYMDRVEYNRRGNRVLLEKTRAGC